MKWHQPRMFETEDLPLFSGGTLHAEAGEFRPPADMQPKLPGTPAPDWNQMARREANKRGER